MKKTFLILVMVSFNIFLYAQTYHPFPTKNAMWTETLIILSKSDQPEFHCYALKDQDTTINGKLYHKIFHSLDTLFTENKLCGGIREENKRIYFYPIDSSGYCGQITTPCKKEEFALYDFSLQVGDSISTDTFRLSAPDYPGYLKVIKIDSILIGNEYRKTFHFGTTGVSWAIPNAAWIEGIGNIKGLLFETGLETACGVYSWLNCFFEENVNLYHNSRNDCFYYLNHTGVQINQNPKELTIRPNPVHTSAIVEFGGNNYSKLKLVDLYGVVVSEYNIKGMTSLEIYKENLPSGVYFLIIGDLNGSLRTTKLIFE